MCLVCSKLNETMTHLVFSDTFSLSHASRPASVILSKCDKAFSLRWGQALNSPLGQVILVKIRHLPESLFRRFTLLGPHNTGHFLTSPLCLALVSVVLVQAPHHQKNQVPGKRADKQNVKHRNSEAGAQNGMME